MVSGAILAGGRAARFGGRNKGELLIRGRRIFDRQIDELAQLTTDILIVANQAGAGTREFEAPGAARIRHVTDRVAGRGPLAGLDAALAEARAPLVIVVACDMPFVTAPLLAYLVSLAGETDAVVPRTNRGYHPLCAVYSRECSAVIQRRLAAGQLALLGLLDDLRVRAVEPSELAPFGNPEHLLANVNTPAEYTAIEDPQTR